ncbi:MAG: peptidase C14, caspase catalytic subunit P20, partial [uncultured bacterium]
MRFYARKALAAAKGLRRPKTDDSLLMLIPDVLDTTTFLRFADEEKCPLIKALIDQNRSDTLPCFLELLPEEKNPRILAAMIMAVGAFGTSSESKVLIPFLSHKDARVRANAIEALELLGNLKLFAYIFPLLEDTDNRVRANAARSLRSIEPFTSFRLLQAMISSGKVPFQASAIYVLRYFISDASAALVTPFLDSPHEDLRRRAAQTLRILAEK